MNIVTLHFISIILLFSCNSSQKEDSLISLNAINENAATFLAKTKYDKVDTLSSGAIAYHMTDTAKQYFQNIFCDSVLVIVLNKKVIGFKIYLEGRTTRSDQFLKKINSAFFEGMLDERAKRFFIFTDKYFFDYIDQRQTYTMQNKLTMRLLVIDKSIPSSNDPYSSPIIKDLINTDMDIPY